jgi:hypothetical protein
MLRMSDHLSLQTAGTTPWHITDFGILFKGESNEIPIQLLPKFEMGQIAPTRLAENV